MRDLSTPLISEIRSLVDEKYRDETKLADLVNTVITEDIDFEHIITFLSQSPSELHRRFADDLRHAFVSVLREKLDQIESDFGRAPVYLYEALFDMYQLPDIDEELRGALTLNYDEYIELAITNVGRDVDLGVSIQTHTQSQSAFRLLKLHGSLGWKYTWPIVLQGQIDNPLWIPPGIQKSKGEYPFDLLWGLARELLDCDVLRIIGCNLGPNDWDLVSLLFATQHTHGTRSAPYRIQVIDSPATASRLEDQFPYLDISSIYEAGPGGRRMFFEVSGGRNEPYRSLTEDEQQDINERVGQQNWFHVWLRHTTEYLYEENGSVSTPTGSLERFLGAA